MNWYIYSLIALILIGMQRFLYKVSAEKKYNTALTTFTFMSTVTLISLVVFFLRRKPPGDISLLLAIGLWNSVAFVIATMSHMESLKHIPASVVYPVIRLNIVIVVIFSILYFDDALSSLQIVGIFTSFAAIMIFRQSSSGGGDSPGDRKRGFTFVIVSLLAGAMAIISSKFAALYTDNIAFMAVSYGFGMVFSLAFKNRLEPAEGGGKAKNALVLGITMGIINFVGFYAFLNALSLGPLAVIGSIMGMHFVIAIILSALIFRERITPTRALAILLTMVSVILLRL